MANGGEEAQDALTGTILAGRFEVVELLARGGMGKVYRAVQMPLGRPVALKVLDIKGSGAARADFRGRFFLEAATAAKLSHPNTVTVFDYGMSGDSIYFIAMELVEGITLSETIKATGPLDPARVAHMGIQICGSLSEAHAMGVVHRDMKPSNVLLTHRGHDPDFVKVVDFGLVKVLGDESDNDFTQTGMMMGTPKYMSPEQISGREVTAHSDMYSLGAVLFYALTGKPPFDAASKFDILTAHVNSAPPAMRDVYPDCAVSGALEEAVRRCMAKTPEERYGSMHEVSRALRACEQELRGTVKKFDRRSRPRPPRGSAEALAEAIAGDMSGAISGTPTGSLPAFGMPSVPAPPALPNTNAFPAQPHPQAPIQSMKWFRIALIASIAINVIAVGGMLYANLRERDSVSVTAPPVHIVSDPPGARLHHNGRDLGDTPASLVIPGGEEWSIEVSLDGYTPRTVVVPSGNGEVRVSLGRGAE